MRSCMGFVVFCREAFGLNGWKLTVGMLETWLRNGGNLSPECWKLQAGIGGNFAPEFAYRAAFSTSMMSFADIGGRAGSIPF